MKTGLELIAQERKEQIEKHGYSIQNDYEQNKPDKLLIAAEATINGVTGDFPGEWKNFYRIRQMVGKRKKERLIIAGALMQGQQDLLRYWIGQLEEDIIKIGNQIDTL